MISSSVSYKKAFSSAGPHIQVFLVLTACIVVNQSLQFYRKTCQVGLPLLGTCVIQFMSLSLHHMFVVGLE